LGDPHSVHRAPTHLALLKTVRRAASVTIQHAEKAQRALMIQSHFITQNDRRLSWSGKNGCVKRARNISLAGLAMNAIQANSHKASSGMLPNLVALYSASCTNPPCSFEDCDTCRRCRDPQCRKGTRCKGRPIPLNPSKRPETPEERQKWLCDTCRKKRCRDCRAPMPSKMRKRQTSAMGWQCSSCSQKELEKKDKDRNAAPGSRFLCAICRENKPQAAYTPGMWKNRHNAGRTTLCLDCCRPRCTMQQCPTCPIRRGESCR